MPGLVKFFTTGLDKPITEYASAMLEIVGYGADSLLELVHRVFGADLVNPLLGLLEEVQVAIGMGVGKYVQAKIAQLKELAGALPDLLTSLRGTIVNAAVAFVVKFGLTKAVKELLKYLAPGGVFFKLVELVWKAAQWLFSQFQKLKKLFSIVRLVFRRALDFAPVRRIAGWVRNFLRNLIGPVLDMLMRFVGAEDLPRRTRELLTTLKEKAQTPVRRVLQAVAKPIKDGWNKGLSRRYHQEDLARGVGSVELPHAFARKAPGAAYEFRWK